MKKIGNSFLVLLYILCSSLSVEAQPSIHFVAPTLSIEPGSYFPAYIRVAGFRKIVGAQYSMNWNPAVLRFAGIENPALNMSATENFGLSGTESGVLSFSWFDPTLSGMTLSDSTILYAIRFQAIGAANTSSTLTFGNAPTVKEVVDTSFLAIEAGFRNGIISVLSPNALNEVSQAPVQISECTPNPFRESTNFSIDLKESAHIAWTVFDSKGRAVFSSEGRFGRGENILNIKTDSFSEPGTYYCRFYFDDGSFVSRKLIKI